MSHMIRSAGGWTRNAGVFYEQAYELGYAGEPLTEIPCACKQCKEAYAEGEAQYKAEQAQKIGSLDALFDTETAGNVTPV